MLAGIKIGDGLLEFGEERVRGGRCDEEEEGEQQDRTGQDRTGRGLDVEECVGSDSDNLGRRWVSCGHSRLSSNSCRAHRAQCTMSRPCAGWLGMGAERQVRGYAGELPGSNAMRLIRRAAAGRAMVGVWH